MARGADFDMQVLAGGAGGEFVPATASHFDRFVLGMDIRFHGGLAQPSLQPSYRTKRIGHDSAIQMQMQPRRDRAAVKA